MDLDIRRMEKKTVRDGNRRNPQTARQFPNPEPIAVRLSGEKSREMHVFFSKRFDQSRNTREY